MPYNGLMQAVTNTWKRLMLDERHLEKSKDCEPFIIVSDKRIDLVSVESYMLYWHFVNKIMKPPTSIDKWVSEFIFLNDQDFSNFYELPYKILRDTKIQTFQYTILHKIFPCGAALHTWKLTENSNCTHCAEHDSLSHFFFDCPATKEF